MARPHQLSVRKAGELLAACLNPAKANLIGYPPCSFGAGLPKASLLQGRQGRNTELHVSFSSFLTFNFEVILGIKNH